MRLPIPLTLRDRQFQRYWSASSISLLGDSTAIVAVSFTIVSVLHASAFEVSLVNALEWLPSLLFALHAGAWADRARSRRDIMVACDVVRFATFASIPIAYTLGALTLTQVCLIIFISGLASVLYNVCDGGYFASIVPRDQYAEGQSLVYGTVALTSLAGPSVGGLLIQLFTAPIAISMNAVSFLFSAFFLGRIDAVESTETQEREAGSAMRGLAYIRHNRAISTTLLIAATVNFFNLIFQALVIFYLVRYLDATAAAVGLILAGQAAGGLLGSAAAAKLTRRFGTGYTLAFGSIAISAPLAFMPFLGRLSPFTIAEAGSILFVSGFGRATQNVCIGTVFALVVPATMRSRVRGAFQFVSFGARPLGALAAGACGTLFGTPATLLISAVGGTLAFIWILPVRRFDQAVARCSSPPPA